MTEVNCLSTLQLNVPVVEHELHKLGFQFIGKGCNLC